MNSEQRTGRLEMEMRRVKRLCELNPGLVEVNTDYLSAIRHRGTVHYRFQLNCESVRLKDTRVVPTQRHEFELLLGPEYPERPPLLRWGSPIFHPNILAPNVCMGLTERWDSNTTIDTVVVWLYDMVRYRLYTLEDSFDPGATRWAREPVRQFPLDERTLSLVEPEIQERIVIRMGSERS